MDLYYMYEQCSDHVQLVVENPHCKTRPSGVKPFASPVQPRLSQASGYVDALFMTTETAQYVLSTIIKCFMLAVVLLACHSRGKLRCSTSHVLPSDMPCSLLHVHPTFKWKKGRQVRRTASGRQTNAHAACGKNAMALASN